MELRIWITWWIMFYIWISDHFEFILKKHGEKTINPPIKICIDKIENRITFKIKTWYYLQFLTPETTKLLGSTKSKITKDKNCGNVSYLEITEIILIHCNVVNNSYQQNSRVLYTCDPNKSFGELLDISPETFIFLKTFDSEFMYLWYIDQNYNPIE